MEKTSPSIDSGYTSAFFSVLIYFQKYWAWGGQMPGLPTLCGHPCSRDNICDVFGGSESNLYQGTTYPEIFRSFPQSLQAKVKDCTFI
jgi:hypothetical protein